MTSAEPAPDPTRRLSTLLELLAVLAVTIARRVGFSSQIDLHAADEIMYLNRGRRILDGDLSAIDLAYSPPYCLSFGILDCFPLGATEPADWMYWLTGIASAVTLWWALRPLASGAVACLLACWWAASPALLQVQQIGFGATPSVYAFTAALVFAAFGAILRRRLVTGLILLLIAGLTRTEFAPWILLFGVALAFAQRPRWRSWPALLGVTGGALLIGLVLSQPTLRSRSWQAFSQHYARAAVTAELREEMRDDGPIDEADAQAAAARLYRSWNDSDQRLAEDFPGATSPLGALRANPQRFFWHVGHNLLATPGSLLYGADSLLVWAPLAPWLGLGLLVVALAAWLRSRGDGSRQALPASAHWFLLSMVGILPSALLVAPRTVLLYPALLILFAPVAVGLDRLGLDRRFGALRCSALMAIAMLLLAAWGPHPFELPARQDLEHRNAIRLLRDELPEQRVRVLAPFATAYASLIGRDRIQPVDLRLRALPPDLEAWLAEQEPDLIVVGGTLQALVLAYPQIPMPGNSPDWRLKASLGTTSLYEPADR